MKDQSTISLSAGLLAAFGATVCCTLPLLLVAMGITGAWMSGLHALSAYRPLFIVVALVAMGVAWWQISRREPVCEPGQVCADPAVMRRRKGLFWAVAVLAAAMIASPWIIAWVM